MFVWSSFVCIDVFIKSFIIISTHCQHHVTSETEFKQDLPNPDLDLLTECSFFTESRFGFTMYLNPDSLIEYPLIHTMLSMSCLAVRNICLVILPVILLSVLCIFHGSSS